MQETHPGGITRREALHRLSLIVGGTLSAPLVAGVLAGCRATPPGEAYALQTLDADQYDLVGTLTELIIPTTDTPGARDAGVPAFIDQMLTTWYPQDDRARILDGLGRLDEHARVLHGTAFIDAEPEQQTALLEAMARQASSMMPTPDPVPLPAELPALFRQLKELTVVGYYTSEVGATQELREMPMGDYRGDIPYDEVGRAWS